ncbi:uncharacterized protein il17rc [Denticeps clupeoides]|uniref:SEFIR domain-containing protein n=1 Tax=Denticeps clupeoides TaxID=299321 RepID=A0AAY4A174_9TELE|nr:uncharacterized protein LOC114780088 [Denticeps clupeoides]XP_028823436.1 uncharacterized protein LOC114780088 [Denticeps clupeoides]XP_028823441.1 uncharacterized protein LOC114780088 [Denticeps clupeoides]XP_028823442.1 uncharacterized protein LOC114780088 [Denticeps clupeoides]XP_028823443.1 uncharacterized protein LOC114780088 [Denticeps clupeoides]XP_028823445.1 uncharacterized protein LOC114780088 [Denticeps clupeoides]XP_028823446.1 uncharacterized protein LOC114780088 [Denticeps cl
MSRAVSLLSLLLLTLRPRSVCGAIRVRSSSQGQLVYMLEDALLPIPLPPTSLDIIGMKAKAVLCPAEVRDCKPHLDIDIQLEVPSRGQDSDGPENEGGSSDPTSKRSTVEVCYTTPPLMSRCCRIEFSFSPFQQNPAAAEWLHLVLESDHVTYGSVVFLKAKVINSVNQTVQVPSADCSRLHADSKECAVPRLKSEINMERREVHVRLVSQDTHGLGPLRTCLRQGEEGHASCRNFSVSRNIPFYSVTPCLCIKAWWENGFRRSRCYPFSQRQTWTESLTTGGAMVDQSFTEVMKRNMWENITVFVDLGETNNGTAVVRWNITSPCSVEAEVCLCNETKETKGGCEEVKGFRQHLKKSSDWRDGFWISGAFEGVNPHHRLCVMVTVMEKRLGTWCIGPEHSSRWHWSLPIVTFLIIGLAVFGLCLYQNTMKKWLEKWNKVNHSEGARGRVLLLHPMDAKESVKELVCRLGTSLSVLGFTVSLDLWSHLEVASLGPAPWLFSQLDQLQAMGGKAVVVLSQTARQRAEEWRLNGWAAEDSVCPSDTFAAALGCLLVDQLQGCAREQFILVQFGCDSPAHCEQKCCLPVLLHGLPMYNLPTESQAFLAALSFKGTFTRDWNCLSHGLKKASKVFMKELQRSENKKSDEVLSGLGQKCEESGATVPLCANC